MSKEFNCSESKLSEALDLIPLGSQTFSKSITQLPRGVSPFFVDSAKGSHFKDIDGNDFIDYSNALASVTLGYRDEDVDEAVKSQLANGVTFSLPHLLEIEVARLIVQMVPCAEMVRFSKNGTDATSGAVRLARHCTNRKRVAICGYHGWQDWSIGTTARNGGIPEEIRDLSSTFKYNDIDSLKGLLATRANEYAAVVLEPMNIEYPRSGFLEEIREICTREGILLVFDETITGFRFANGGAQELFGVLPDLATFGKGLANGYPLSALTGRRKYMERISEIFFSGTFGGETLSLAASQAVLRKLQSDDVLKQIEAYGKRLASSIEDILVRTGLVPYMRLGGHPSWKIWSFMDSSFCSAFELKTFVLQEMFERGVFTIGSHNISYAHTEADLITTTEAYYEVLSLVKERISKKGGIRAALRCEVLEPLFKVR